ncbi:MAG: HEAT repeat domain-containing protein [Phycisphaeraceae bacterium]|nr:HEAT repeat domain-containing protein [Phycisphaeraceae bacterium]
MATSDDIERLAAEVLELALCVPAAAGTLFGRSRGPVPEADLALRVLAQHWPRLPRMLRTACESVGEERWAEVAAALLSDASVDGRLAGIGLISSSAAACLRATGLPSLLADQVPEVANAAEKAIFQLAVRLRRDLEPQWLQGDDTLPDFQPGPESATALRHAEQIRNAVAEACRRYAEHRRKSALFAAILLLAEPGDRRSRLGIDDLDSLCADHAHPAGGALRTLLRWHRAPAVREAALRLLARDDLAAAAIDRIARGYSPEDHACMLSSGHLLEHPCRIRRLAIISVRARPEKDAEGVARRAFPPEGPFPDAETYSMLPFAARCMLPRFVHAIELDARDRDLALEPAMVDPSPAARLAALGVAGESLTAEFVLDDDARVARAAAWRLSTAGVGRWAYTVLPIADDRRRLWRSLERSRHAVVRRVAEEESARIDPWRCEAAASRVLARSRLALRREETLEELRSRIRTEVTQERLRAVAVARCLGVVAEVLAALMATVQDDDCTLASAAVAALGDIDDASVDPVLQELVEHVDGRLRANAVESIWRRAARKTKSPEIEPTLLELKSDGVSRVRANAIRGAIIASGWSQSTGLVGRAALLNMLDDDRSEHRRSALWVLLRSAGGPIRHGGLGSAFAKRLSHLAAIDTDSTIRARAGQCLRVMGHAPAKVEQHP